MKLPDYLSTRDKLLYFLHQQGIPSSPAGSDKEVQYNNAGSFGASPNFTWTTTGLFVTGSVGATGSVAFNTGDLGVHITGSGSGTLFDISYDTALEATPAIQVTASTYASRSRVGLGTNAPEASLHISSSTLACLLRVDSADSTNASLLYVSASGDVGLGIDIPKTHLDVFHGYVDWLNDDTGGGESVTFGSGTTVAGKLYYLNTSGQWVDADADAVASGASQLLGIALGTDPSTHGMLIRGFFQMTATGLTGTWNEGIPLYVSTDAAKIQVTAPSATGDFVRVVGYCGAGTTNMIYFNPDGTYIEIS
tara:strand:- start:9076 stop:9999 length:924 start_codon:yes stop_codon:yes gene_type:complete